MSRPTAKLARLGTNGRPLARSLAFDEGAAAASPPVSPPRPRLQRHFSMFSQSVLSGSFPTLREDVNEDYELLTPTQPDSQLQLFDEPASSRSASPSSSLIVSESDDDDVAPSSISASVEAALAMAEMYAGEGHVPLSDDDDVVIIDPAPLAPIAPEPTADAAVPGRWLPDTGFRFQGVKLGLTYSCPRGVGCAMLPPGDHSPGCACTNPIPSAQALADALVAIWPCDYVVSTELHVSGKTHYHAHLRFHKKQGTTNPRKFDLFGVHPNILVPRGNGRAWEGYVTKKGEYVTNYLEDNPFRLAMNASSAEDAVREVFDKDPRAGVVYHAQIAGAWAALNKEEEKALEPLTFKVPIPNLGRSRAELLAAGLPNGRKDDEFCIIVQGPAGIGKTEFALRFFGADGAGVRLISHIDDLKKHDLRGLKAVVFDDMDFKKWPRQSQIHLCDAAKDRSIHCRYNNVSLPSGLVRIFTCNVKPGVSTEDWAEPGVDVNLHWPVDMTDPAIKRRVQILDLSTYSMDDPLF